MGSLAVYNLEGKEVGNVDVDSTDFAESVNKQLLHDAVVMYQNNLRNGNAKTKNRSEVAGSMKKLYRQKGTGNARAGTRKSGIRRGGGHIFAIRPRDYTYRMPRKMLQKATRMAIAAKLQSDQVTVVDTISLSAPSTKTLATAFGKLGLAGKTILIATEGVDRNTYKSVRNIPGVEVLPASDLTAYALLKPHRVIFVQGALEALKKG
ncbi:MAG: 50S ribosomal protein L4 [Pirellulaceae bacterium]|nr:50S ribosomal protein L4 [Pirellulaceae bacterium]